MSRAGALVVPRRICLEFLERKDRSIYFFIRGIQAIRILQELAAFMVWKLLKLRELAVRRGGDVRNVQANKEISYYIIFLGLYTLPGIKEY